MSAEPARILAEVSILLRGISDSLLPGEEITMETRFIDDLGMSSIGLANLSGRVQAKYGAAVSLVPFLAGRGARPLSDMQVGELVEYVASVLDAGSPDTSADAAEVSGTAVKPVRIVTAASDLAPPTPDRAGGRNDNAAVLAENATGIIRRLLRLDGAEVEVFSAGSGTPLILMHPLNVGAGVFARQIASLADRHQVICIHSPGVGATTSQADVTLSSLARLYRAVLDELSVAPPFNVLGSCFGGVIAQEFALLHPEECASLVLVGCSYRTGGSAGGYRPLSVIAADEFDRMDEGGDYSPEGKRSELQEHLLRCESMDPRAGLRYLALLATKPSLYAQLPEISAPTLILRGEHDTMASAKDAHTMFGAIPDAHFAEISNAGHFPYLTHPTEFGRHLVPFLAASAWQRRQAKGSVVTQPAPRPGTSTAAIPDPERCVIISTGRCGSTLLSDLIAEDRETLSVYESLHPIIAPLMFTPVSEFTGAEYWKLLSEVEPPGSPLLRVGVVPPEFAYPSSGRWPTDNIAMLPPLLHVCLPKISADPDQLFDELAVAVPRFPTQPVATHHRMLLDLLAAMHGRLRWVERSGGSAVAAYPWLASCLDAKIIYLTRNLADTTRSMRRHPVFQLLAIQAEFRRRYGAEPYTKELASEVPEAAMLPEEMRRLLPGQLTAQTFQELDLGLEVYERFCGQMNHAAELALAELRPCQLLRLRYEDLVADPVHELARVGAFLGFTDPVGWAAATAPRVGLSRAASASGARGA